MSARRRRISIVVLLLDAILFLVLSASLSAQSSSGRILAGIGGYGRAPGWLRVTGVAQDDPIAVQGTDGRSLTVADHLGSWVVPLRSAEESVTVAGEAVNVRLLPPNQPLVAVLSTGNRLLRAFENTRSGFSAPIVISLLPAWLPNHPMAMQPVSAIVIDDIQPGVLNTNQVRAILQWTALGGTTIVVSDRRFLPSGTPSDDLLHPELFPVLLDAAPGSPAESGAVVIPGSDGTPRMSMSRVGGGRLLNLRLDGVDPSNQLDLITTAIRFLPSEHSVEMAVGSGGNPLDLGTLISTSEARTGRRWDPSASGWRSGSAPSWLLTTASTRLVMFVAVLIATALAVAVQSRPWIGVGALVVLFVWLNLPGSGLDGTVFVQRFETWVVEPGAAVAERFRTVTSTSSTAGNLVVTSRGGLLPVASDRGRVVRTGAEMTTTERAVRPVSHRVDRRSYVGIDESPLLVAIREDQLQVTWQGFDLEAAGPGLEASGVLIALRSGRPILSRTVSAGDSIRIPIELPGDSGNHAEPSDVTVTTAAARALEPLRLRSTRNQSIIVAVLAGTPFGPPTDTDVVVQAAAGTSLWSPGGRTVTIRSSEHRMAVAEAAVPR